MKTPSSIFDIYQVSKAFNQAAQTYDLAAVLAREVGNRLLQRLDFIPLQPHVILDVGCGTGFTTRLLEQRFKKTPIVAVDLSYKMLLQTKQQKKWLSKQKYVCANAQQLPFADHSIDFIFSNLLLHWCNDLTQTIQELQRVLKPDGLLLFSTFGPDTFKELRASWAQVDAMPHVHDFIDMHHIGDLLLRAPFKNPVMDVENLTLTYTNLQQFMRELKASGTYNMRVDRHKGLTGKNAFQKLLQAYEMFRNADNVLPVTYEVIYGHAWGRELSQINKQGEIGIPINRIIKK
jgi:malonyl-CoA O-methyltransferase